MSWNLLYALDLLALTGFIGSYFRNCYRKGYRIDFWHFQLFLVMVLPMMLMLPFAAAPENAIVLGSEYAAVAAAVPGVFLISMAGYAAFLTGGAVWRWRLGLGLRKAVADMLAPVPRYSMMMMSSRTVLVFQTLLCLGLESLVLVLNWTHQGFNLDLRSYAFENPMLRPVVQTTSFYSSIIASHCMARYMDRKERSMLACNLLLALGLLLFGSRGGLIIIYINLLVCSLMRRRRRVSLLGLGFLGTAIVLVIFYLGSIRSGSYSLGDFLSSIMYLLLFGDNFSDLRDFAWVYASWDHVFWAGRTYLAAMMAFVPRFLSDFRDTWGMGAATARTVGFDPHEHPGLRPGFFGEGYFNFGIAGVLVVGFISGMIIRKIDIDTRHQLQSSKSAIMPAFASTMLIQVAGTVTLSVNSSLLIVLGAVYLISWFGLKGLRLFRRRADELPELE